MLSYARRLDKANILKRLSLHNSFFRIILHRKLSLFKNEVEEQ